MKFIVSNSFRENLSRFIITVVILLSPFYRALYPDFYKIPFLSLIFLAFLSYHVLFFRKKELYFELQFPVIIFILLALVYLLSVFNAASKGSALIIFLSYTAWAALFWMVIELFNIEPVRVMLLKLIVCSATILGLVGFLGALNQISPSFQNLFGMSFWGLYFSGRINSTFQYPNTSASFYAITLFLGLYLQLQQPERLQKVLYSILNYVIFSAFFFAFSRGANVAILITLGFFFLVLPQDTLRVKSSSFLVALLFPFLLFQSKLDNSLVHSSALAFWILYLIGLLIFIVLTFCISFASKKYYQFFSKKKVLVLLLIILSIELVFLFFIKVQEKGREMSLETTNVIQRFTFYHDALKMGLKRPWLGWGGGGWAAHYFFFQSSTYYTKFAHSFYLDTFIESGFIGLILVLFLIFYIFWNFLKKTLSHSTSEITAFLATTVFFIFIHSSIDLNFAMGAYHIIAWTMLALLVSKLPSPHRPIRVPIQLTFIITLFLFLLSILWGDAEYYYQISLKMKNDNETVKAAQALENATKFNPFLDDGYHQMTLLARELYMQSGRKEFFDLAWEKNQESLKLEPYNYEYHRQLADFLLMKNDLEQAWTEYNNSMELAPLVTGNYEKILFFYLQILEYFKKEPNNQIMSWVHDKTEEVLERFQDNQAKTAHPIPPSEVMMSLIENIQQLVGGEN